MRHRILSERDGQRTMAVAMEVGDRAIESILELAGELDLKASEITGIGAFESVQLGYFNGRARRREEGKSDDSFLQNDFEEQFEVLAFTGNLTREEESGDPHAHVHVVLGRPDATTMGGHLIEGTVHPTLELLITETGGEVPRGVDPETGLVVMKP